MFLIIRVSCIVLLSTTYGYTQTLKLWYDKPAAMWEETLPLGNGRLGMMPDGGVHKETIVLNDIRMLTNIPHTNICRLSGVC